MRQTTFLTHNSQYFVFFFNKCLLYNNKETTTFIRHIPNQLALFPQCASQFHETQILYIIRANQINFN